MARPAQPEFALRIGPIWSRKSVGVIEPGHGIHPAGPVWSLRAVPSMCTSILPPYQTGKVGASSRTDGSLNVRISSQIALFRSPLIPGRQLTAVGFKTPALQVANYASPDNPLIRLMKATRIQPETELSRSPGAEPEPHRLGAIATGPQGVGTVLGWVIGGHRGRREATAIPTLVIRGRVGKGLR